MSTFLKVLSILLLGALGALVFNVFLLPFMLTSPYFENFQFVKNFKDGRVVVNPKEEVYIQENTAIEEAVQRVEKSVVAVESAKLKLHSGLIVTSDGDIITLASVANRGAVTVWRAGEKVSAKVVTVDGQDNLTLLKVDKSNLPTVAFADPEKIALGQTVFLVASASKAKNSWLVNEGVVREMDGRTITTTMREGQDVAGSPLFNSAGELVGITFIDSAGMVSAVPVDRLRALLGLQ